MRTSRNFTIGDMAQQSGVSQRTIRFYEQQGLLSPMRVGFARVYSESDRLKLADIVRWRAQGFTVAEAKKALREGGFSKEKIDAQIQHLRQQRDEIDKAIAELMEVEQ